MTVIFLVLTNLTPELNKLVLFSSDCLSEGKYFYNYLVIFNFFSAL